MSCTASAAWGSEVDGPTWDVLISTIPHRDALLRKLLAELDRQWKPGLGVRVLRDNLERPGLESHAKRGELVRSSSADYVCDLDDDDWISTNYVSAIMNALQSRPDYVGFRVNWTRNGEPYGMARHSLEYDGYAPGDSLWWHRDITHLNPLRRDLALLASWDDRIDEQWAEQLRKTGQVKTQVMIEKVLYHYRFEELDNFNSPRDPWVGELEPLPRYPWLTIL